MTLFLASGSLFFGCMVPFVQGNESARVMVALSVTSLGFAALACASAGVL